MKFLALIAFLISFASFAQIDEYRFESKAAEGVYKLPTGDIQVLSCKALISTDNKEYRILKVDLELVTDETYSVEVLLPPNVNLERGGQYTIEDEYIPTTTSYVNGTATITSKQTASVDYMSHVKRELSMLVSMNSQMTVIDSLELHTFDKKRVVLTINPEKSWVDAKCQF